MHALKMDHNLENGLKPKSVCNEIIDDIEDLISAYDITPKERYSNRKTVKVKAKRKTDNVCYKLWKKMDAFMKSLDFRKMRIFRRRFLVTSQAHKQFT